MPILSTPACLLTISICWCAAVAVTATDSQPSTTFIPSIFPSANSTTSSEAAVLPNTTTSNPSSDQCHYSQLPSVRSLLWSSGLLHVLTNTNATTRQQCELQCCSVLACNIAALASNGSCQLLNCGASISVCVSAEARTPAEAVQQRPGGLAISVVLRGDSANVTTSAGLRSATFNSTASGVQCQPDNTTTSSAGASSPAIEGSTGVSSVCGPDARCVPLPDRPDRGLCRCVAGRVPDPVTGECRPVEVTTPTPRVQLQVAVDNQTLQLPANSVNLTARVLPPDPSGSLYHYRWTRIPYETGAAVSKSTSSGATISGNASPQLQLRRLAAGVYVFRLDVLGAGTFGATTVNVTVLPPVRANRPPVAVISPASQTKRLPFSKVFMDGSQSLDDGGGDDDSGLRHLWTIVSAPLEFHMSRQLDSLPTLELDDLVPGNYTISLTVVDRLNATNSTLGHITVLPEIDNPPQANAGDPQKIYLPKNEVILNGNLSTDDKGIKSYEWTLGPESENKAVDIEDSHSAFLHVSDLEEGTYTFILRVTDAAGQSSTASTVVLVLSQPNQTPTADAGANQTITMPRTWAILDGTGSKDDQKITKWIWKQLSGPSDSVLLNATTSRANATALTRGVYSFSLTVWDDVSNVTNTTNVTVLHTTNQPPVSDAGGDLTLHLPVSVLTLNGTRSRDDVSIVSWRWSRDPASVAAGDIVGTSDHTPILQVVNVIAGKYRFTLTVTDDQGATSSDTASVIVQPDPDITARVRLELDVPYNQVLVAQRVSLSATLALLLPADGTVVVDILRWTEQPDSGRLLVELRAAVTWLADDGRTHKRLLAGRETARTLRTRLRADPQLLDSGVVQLRTVVCQNPCSDHGVCVEESRQCRCHRFWTQNPLRRHLGDGEANCDWSLLYVIIGGFSLSCGVGACCWGCVCLIRRRAAGRRRRGQTYSALSDDAPAADQISVDTMRMMPRDSVSASGLMRSESDTDSDTLFEPAERRRSKLGAHKRRKRVGNVATSIHKNGKKV